MLDHRSVYKQDVLIFLPLALPWINVQLLTFLLSIGAEQSFVFSTLESGLLGLFGTLGLAFSWLRLSVDDSRSMVAISLTVKVAAAIWLAWMAVALQVPALYLLAGLDALAAVVCFASLILPQFSSLK